MADNVSKEKRREIMRAVKSKDSKIEVIVRKKLWALGFRYRKNSKKYFGKPDIVLKKHKTAIFIDSCFWHGCVKHCRMPSSQKKYWKDKIERNRDRDKEVCKHYKSIKWNCFRIWEHDLRNIDKALSRLVSKLEEKRML